MKPTPKQPQKYFLISDQSLTDPSPQSFTFFDVSQKVAKKYFYIKAKDCFYRAIACPIDGSWFIDSTVVPKGDIIVLHEIDPVFILLPVLALKKSVKITLEQLLDEHEQISESINKLYCTESTANKILLVSARVKKALEEICDTMVFEDEEEKLYQLSSSKLNSWLKSKYEDVVKELRKDEKAKEEAYEDHYKKIALGIICEELPENVAEEFVASCTGELKFKDMKSYGGGISSGKRTAEAHKEDIKEVTVKHEVKKKAVSSSQENSLDKYFSLSKPKK